MQSKYKSIFKASVLMSFLVIGVVVAMVYVSQVQGPIIQTVTNQARTHLFPLGDAFPGTGKSGYLAFYIYPHSADPANDYDTNLTNATAYEHYDVNTGEMTHTTPYSTAFDFIVKYRLNVSDGYNSSSGWWTLNWSYMVMACNFNWTADITSTTMTDVKISNGADYIYINAYLNNAGAGYQLSKNEKASWNTSGWVLR